MSTQGITQKTIGEVVYAFRTLPASKAMEVWSALEPLVTRAGAENSLSAVAAVGGKEIALIAGRDMPAHEKESLIATVTMLSALSQLSDDDWDKPNGGRMMGRRRLIKIMFEYVTVGGKPIDADVNFTGRLRALYQVLGEAMRFNFSDFFSGLAAVTDSLHGAGKPE
jgi:tail assembly chaperone